MPIVALVFERHEHVQAVIDAEADEERHAQERERAQRDAGDYQECAEKEEREAEGGEIEQYHAKGTLGDGAQDEDGREHPDREAAEIGERDLVELVFERDPAHRQHFRSGERQGFNLISSAGRGRALGGVREPHDAAAPIAVFPVELGEERGHGGEGVVCPGGGAIEGLGQGEGGAAPFAAEAA